MFIDIEVSIKEDPNKLNVNVCVNNKQPWQFTPIKRYNIIKKRNKTIRNMA